MQGYIQAKWQMFENLQPGSTAIIGVDGPNETALAELASSWGLNCQCFEFSGQAEENG